MILVGSSIPIGLAEHAAGRGRIRQVRALLALAFAMAALFLANQLWEYRGLDFRPGDNAYASIFYAVTGLHGLHVLGALVMSTMVQAKAWTGRIGPGRMLTLRVFGIYWHFVDGVWILVFSSLFLLAHVGTR